MHKIKNIFEKDGINKVNVKAIENELGFGIDAETVPKSSTKKTKIEINESLKQIFVDMRIKNKKEFVLKCSSTKDVIQGLIPKEFEESKFAITQGGLYYSAEFGETEEAPESHYILEVETDGTLKDEYESRITDLTEVCQRYGVDAKRYMYNEKIFYVLV